MSLRTRREWIALLGLLAGCTGGPGSNDEDLTATETPTETLTETPTRTETPTTTPSETPTKTPTPAPEPVDLDLQMGETADLGAFEVTISNPRVQEAVIQYNGSFYHLTLREGVQWIVVDMEFVGDTPTIAGMDWSTRIDGEERWEGDGPLPDSAMGVPHEGYDPVTREDGYESDEGYATGGGFEASARAAEEGEIVLSRERQEARWKLPNEVLATLGKVPDFRVRDARLVPGDEWEMGIELTVENVGDRDGVYRALVGPSNLPDAHTPVFLHLPQSETVTRALDAHSNRDPDENRLQEWDEDSRGFTYEGK